MEAPTRELLILPPPLPGRWDRWERLPPGGHDPLRLWLGVGAGAMLLGAAYVWSGWPLPQCLFHALTGLPCPGCGTTRAILHFAQGDFGTALRLNPLATVAMGMGLLWAAYAVLVVCSRGLRWRWDKLAAPWPNRLRLGLALAIVANWLWLLADGR